MRATPEAQSEVRVEAQGYDRLAPRTAAILIAAGVFLLDAFSPIEGAVAVLYVVVVLIAARTFSRRGVVLTTAGCLALTLAAYFAAHRTDEVGAPLLRCFVSLAAIGITAALGLRHKADAAVLAEQASLLDLTHDAVFVRDTRDVITFWNRAAEQFYGWPADEAIGCVAHDLLRSTFPADRAAIFDTLHRTGRWEGELVQRTRAGETVTVESRWVLQRAAAGAPLAVLETNTDITERKRTDSQLVASERRYRAIFDNTRVAILQQDWSGVKADLDRLHREGVRDVAGYCMASEGCVVRMRNRVRIVDANSAAQRMLRAPSREALLGTLDERLPEADQTFPQALAALARGERSFESESQVRTYDGETIPVLFGVSFPADPDDLGFVLVHAFDITERKQAESALLAVQADLAHAARVSTMGELTATMAHEINQPLAAIVTNGEAALRWLKRPSPDLGEATDALGRVITNGRRASEIVGRIRGFLKKAAPRQEWLDLPEMIGEASQLIERELVRHAVSLRTEHAPGLPQVLGDRLQLQQVAINLMVNGIQAMAAVRGRPRVLTVRTLREEDGQVACEVTDTGEGIAPEMREQIFQPFYTTKGDGMGMGLAICRSTIEAHGGRLWVTDTGTGTGATFHILLPAGAAP
ncbi:PAS domain-containing sensor histidine kinase [Methylobacterium nonmethylotrophicum]|uniref:histidine kinase n=1 Tax=Methylobacterium nonmethylotrophicum TaxID=1141884 RepID=A0A4Z0NMV5_9HYPH|nr:PAS domain-containing sensor histidine kinase [Methylobacterium nonmethylotrophicum]TGD97727.1 PAS domain-containing sensor histidine kinase [Methylobacterium nonmethylotrophicum]